METTIVNILGECWTIVYCNSKNDKCLETMAGYCDYTIRKIVISTDMFEEEAVTDIADKQWKLHKVVRHEVIHAFLYESGLSENSVSVEAWAENEEMVDWIAFQLPKIVDVCKQLNTM
jgi:hypothetical protein